MQLRIEGNEELINDFERVLKNENNQEPRSISEMLEKMWNRRSNNNRIDDSIKEQSGQNESSSRLSNRAREEQFHKFGQNSKAGNENSNVKRL